jgi:predicted ABC-type exoprotein transport system permease subunit
MLLSLSAANGPDLSYFALVLAGLALVFFVLALFQPYYLLAVCSFLCLLGTSLALALSALRLHRLKNDPTQERAFRRMRRRLWAALGGVVLFVGSLLVVFAQTRSARIE